jgi:hypothetical protein
VHHHDGLLFAVDLTAEQALRNFADVEQCSAQREVDD